MFRSDRQSARTMIAAVLFPILAGCATMPDLGDAPTPITSGEIEAGESLAGDPIGAWPQESWWERFEDPQLNALIEEGLRNSPDIAAAAARFRRAETLAQEAGAARLPQVDANGSVYTDRRSLNSGFGDGIKQFLPRGWKEGGDLSAHFGFDIDLWGRTLSRHEAARARARAAAIDAAQARLMLAAGIAEAYADLGRLIAERTIRQNALDIRVATRDLVSERLANGLEMRGSLRQADAQVATSRGNLAFTDRQIAVRRHQIAALIGAGPDRGMAIEAPALSPVAGLAIPENADTGLLARRPDVLAARALVEAASRDMSVTRADFYPVLRLDALIGLQSQGLDRLFESDSVYGRAGPAINLPIFRGGELQGRYRAARADFDAAVARYDRTVLDAYREVADIVTSRRLAQSQLADAREAMAASEEAYTIATLRYDGGLSNYLDVLTVEDRLLASRLTVAELEEDMQTLDIALLRALGGGFGSAGAEGAGDMTDG